jgi:peptidoglycan/xylan/chitin deacetylase (PgdA/CDA1 family)
MSLHVYLHGRRDIAKAALTFDDGPNPPRTDEVLQILVEAGVRATFFVIGKWVERFPRALERIVEHGHVVGNHSYAHHSSVGDYDAAEATIANITGTRSTFVRAHGFDYPSLSLSVLAQHPATRVIDADVNPADYAQTEPSAVVAGVLGSESLGNGSIIDLHDGSESEDAGQRLSRPLPMIEALPEIIEGLRRRGLELVGLDELELSEPRRWPEDIADRRVITPTGSGLVVNIPH